MMASESGDQNSVSFSHLQDESPTGAQNGDSVEAHSADAETAATPHDTAEKSSDTQTAEVEKLSAEVGELRDRLLRTVAEMDNMRKRQEREKQDFLKFANESILKDLIPVLDSFDKAVAGSTQQQGGDSASYRDGVLMVHKQLLQTLGKHGLEPIESVDKPFDPNLHQAIQRVETDEVTVDTVLAEFAKGYLLHSRLIRPSMVSVKVPK